MISSQRIYLANSMKGTWNARMKREKSRCLLQSVKSMYNKDAVNKCFKVKKSEKQKSKNSVLMLIQYPQKNRKKNISVIDTRKLARLFLKIIGRSKHIYTRKHLQLFQGAYVDSFSNYHQYFQISVRKQMYKLLYTRILNSHFCLHIIRITVISISNSTSKVIGL